ncbi:MAG: hypothetical protein ACREEM_01160 [Blastocatellia bacterium]
MVEEIFLRSNRSQELQRRNLLAYNPDLYKGASADALIDPDEYLQIEQKQRSVSQEAYEWVYTKVWERWYQTLSYDEGYWDDQDLARYLIEKELIQPVYPAIFCDEAQDFTRLELEVILRMSIFSQRKMMPAELPRVPFVFAGDPFQTLNPTGFRWDAVKAWFAEKFIFALDPSGRSGLNDLNYRELTYNYRSSKPIVGFSNFVQALRACLFNVAGVLPQQPWGDDEGAPVMLFKPDDAAFWDSLEKFSDVVFVVPCPEGDEVQFIRDDACLKKRIPLVDGIPSLPVLSAARAKGLEFNRVVVYGFGTEADPNILASLEGGRSHSENRDASLPLEYFINRLYVAISRPKRQLLILDSTEGVERLWRFSNRPEIEEAILSGIKKGREIWGDHIVRLQSGNVAQMDTSSPIDHEANAEALARDGRGRQDTYKLRQAALVYRNAQKEDKAIRCQAEADELEANYESAGKGFLKIADVDSVIRCFWRAEADGWPLLLDASKKHPDMVGRLEYEFANFLAGSKALASAKRAMENLCQVISGGRTQEIRDSRTAWSRAVDATLNAFLQQKGDGAMTKADWQTLDSNLAILSSVGLTIAFAAESEIAFRSGNFNKVVTLLEQNGKTDSKNYKIAKAESAAYPDRLTALAEINSWDRIVEQWSAHPDVGLIGSNAGWLAVALAKKGRMEEAEKFAVRSCHFDSVDQVLRICNEAKKTDLIQRMAPLRAALSVREAKWDVVGKITKEEKQPDSPSVVGLVRALARSDVLTRLPGDTKFGSSSQSAISTFLRDKFIKTDRGVLEPLFAKEVGAAIERAGKQVDALQYYESIEKQYSDADSSFAKERWIVSKERQAAIDEKRGDNKTASQRRKEASEARKRIGKESETLFEYPRLSSLDDLINEIASVSEKLEQETGQGYQEEIFSESNPAKSPTNSGHETPTLAAPAKIEITKLPFRFEFFQKAGRLNITHTDTGETGNIKAWGASHTSDWKLDTRFAEKGSREIVSDLLPFSIICVTNTYNITFKNEGVTLIFYAQGSRE